MALDDVISRLEGMGLRSQGDGRWKARCPGHDDREASLSVTRGTDGRALIKCFAGCSADQIVGAMGLKLTDLFADDRREVAQETLPKERWPVTREYIYRAADGSPLHRKLRKTSPDSGRKTFEQERWAAGRWVRGLDGIETVLFDLPRLLDPELSDETVFLVEGERDAENLSALGALATTQTGGADGRWLPSYASTLKGRRVVIIPDNDEPGDKHAKRAVEALRSSAASVQVLKLPGLPPKGDVSDWIGAGGTLEQIHAMVARLGTGARFMSSSARLVGEREDRLQAARGSLSFGVKFLDEALVALNRHDLVIVGAETGIGKTQLALIIALRNAAAGKRVHFFALEAEEREIERRVKWQYLSGLYHRNVIAPRTLRFAEWMEGRLENELGRFEAQADADASKALKNLHTYYRVDSFTGSDFARQLVAMRDDTDLVILDHLHYVDHERTDGNETRAMRELVQRIRDSQLSAEVPVLAVAHLRKADRRFAPLVPSVDEFEGSGHIGKTATKAITIAADRTFQTSAPHLWATYMRAVKFRRDGSAARVVARVTYDARTDTYEDAYTLGRLIEGDRVFSELPSGDFPSWSRSALPPVAKPDNETEDGYDA